MPVEKSKVGVIGAGMGGLTAATELAHRGFAVSMFERNAEAGGKLGVRRKAGFVWDTGPSLLTLPGVLRRFWSDLGSDLDRSLELVRLDPICRYFWRDGTRIDQGTEFFQRPDVARFLKHGAGLWEISEEAFLERPLEDLWRQFHPRNWPKLRHFRKIASPRSLDSSVRRFFTDPHLVQLYDRYATYNGSSPYRTPAAFNIIAYAEAAFGGWYVRGGLGRIPEELLVLFRDFGGTLHQGIDVTGVKRRNDGRLELSSGNDSLGIFDYVVCNQDVLSSHAELLPPEFREPFQRRHAGRDLSTSGQVLLLGVEGEHPELLHHNILFSDDYPREFSEIHEQRRPPRDPTIYIAIDGRHDTGRAPEGCHGWFVLVNVPAQLPGETFEWEAYAEHILQRLPEFGIEKPNVRVMETHGPAEFRSWHKAHGGALYGYASHGLMAAFQRPSRRLRSWPNFLFAGGTTHPGGGIPLAILSGRMAARDIVQLNQAT